MFLLVSVRFAYTISPTASSYGLGTSGIISSYLATYDSFISRNILSLRFVGSFIFSLWCFAAFPFFSPVAISPFLLPDFQLYGRLLLPLRDVDGRLSTKFDRNAVIISKVIIRQTCLFCGDLLQSKTLHASITLKWIAGRLCKYINITS